MRKLEESLAVDQLTRKEKAVLEFARKVSHAPPRASDGDLRELIAVGCSPVEIGEIAYLASNNALSTFWVTSRLRELLPHGGSIGPDHDATPRVWPGPRPRFSLKPDDSTIGVFDE